jgi:hypothetical protein
MVIMTIDNFVIPITVVSITTSFIKGINLEITGIASYIINVHIGTSIVIVVRSGCGGVGGGAIIDSDGGVKAGVRRRLGLSL